MSLPDDLNMTDAQLIKLCRFQAAAIEAKDVEIAELKADKDVIRSQERNGSYERDIDALEAEIAKLREALKLVRGIIVEGALTGFNPQDGDWAERLFVSQGATHAALEQRVTEGKK